MSENYTQNMNRVITRVGNVAKDHRSFLNVSVVAAIATVIIFFAIDVILGPLVWLKILGIIVLVGWLVIYSKFLSPFRVPVTCLSCEKQVNLNQDWICGYCDDEKSPMLVQTYVRYNVPLEKCKACDERATAVQCPYCEEDIVFRIDEYNQQETAGVKRFGVARFL